MDKYFTDTVSRVGGVTLKDIENDMDVLHSAAFDPLGLDVDLTLDSVGSHKSRSGQEEHLYNPLPSPSGSNQKRRLQHFQAVYCYVG